MVRSRAGHFDAGKQPTMPFGIVPIAATGRDLLATRSVAQQAFAIYDFLP
jgi:hypothetical protein